MPPLSPWTFKEKQQQLESLSGWLTKSVTSFHSSDSCYGVLQDLLYFLIWDFSQPSEIDRERTSNAVSIKQWRKTRQTGLGLWCTGLSHGLWCQHPHCSARLSPSCSAYKRGPCCWAREDSQWCPTHSGLCLSHGRPCGSFRQRTVPRPLSFLYTNSWVASTGPHSLAGLDEHSSKSKAFFFSLGWPQLHMIQATLLLPLKGWKKVFHLLLCRFQLQPPTDTHILPDPVNSGSQLLESGHRSCKTQLSLTISHIWET